MRYGNIEKIRNTKQRERERERERGREGEKESEGEIKRERNAEQCTLYVSRPVPRNELMPKKNKK